MGWQKKVGKAGLAKEEEAQGEAQEKVTISYASSNVEKPFFLTPVGREGVGDPFWVLPRSPVLKGSKEGLKKVLKRS